MKSPWIVFSLEVIKNTLDQFFYKIDTMMETYCKWREKKWTISSPSIILPACTFYNYLEKKCFFIY